MESQTQRNDGLVGLAEVAVAFARCKNVEAAKRCVRVFVRHDEKGEPVLVFGWAPS